MAQTVTGTGRFSKEAETLRKGPANVTWKIPVAVGRLHGAVNGRNQPSLDCADLSALLGRRDLSRRIGRRKLQAQS